MVKEVIITQNEGEKKTLVLEKDNMYFKLFNYDSGYTKVV